MLFGGFSSAGHVGDTWEWDGATWSNRAPIYGDTWLWDGATQSNPAPAVNPGPLVGHRMAFDGARERVVLFGGSGATLSEATWEWDGTSWVQR